MNRKLMALAVSSAFGAALFATAVSSAQATVVFGNAGVRPSGGKTIAITTPTIPSDWNFVVATANLVTAVTAVATQLLPKSSSSSSSSASGYTASGTDFGEHYDPAALDITGFDK